MKPALLHAFMASAFEFTGMVVGVTGPPMLKSVAKPPAADMKRKVFVTRTGGTYHRDSCRFLAKSKIEMALGLARQKYRPCSRCAPPK